MPHKSELSGERWPAGLVVWCDYINHRMGVLCSYCDKIEEHEVPKGIQSTAPATRHPISCRQHDVPLTLVFPYEDHAAADELGWELNITNNRYQVVGISMHEFTQSEQLDCHLGKSAEAMSDTNKKIFSRNIKNESLDPEGNTALAAAVIRGDIEEIKTQLASGADIDAQNHKGTTPLMLAAERCKLDIVILLLANGAWKNVCDGGRKTARDFIQEKIYAQEPAAMERDRALIKVLLGPEGSLSREKEDRSFPNIHQILTIHDGSRSKSRNAVMGIITVLQPVKTFVKVPNVYGKTVGVLHRGASYPPIYAISGFREGAELVPWLLNCDMWTRDVEAVAQSIGYDLKKSYRDQSAYQICKDGTSDACHAEKQLIAYAVRKHPPHIHRRLKTVSIAVDHPHLICQGCLEFRDKAEVYSGLEIIFVMLEQQQKKRDPTTFTTPRTPSRRGPDRASKTGLTTPPWSLNGTAESTATKRTRKQMAGDEAPFVSQRLQYGSSPTKRSRNIPDEINEQPISESPDRMQKKQNISQDGSYDELCTPVSTCRHSQKRNPVRSSKALQETVNTTSVMKESRAVKTMTISKSISREDVIVISDDESEDDGGKYIG